MLHEHHTSHGGENAQDNFWTDIPEGGDMLPGQMPGGLSPKQMDDLYPTGHHATQQDEYGTGIDPHGPDQGLALPGDAPKERPDIQARGDGSGLADWDSTRTGAGENARKAFGEPNHMPGNYGRTAAQVPNDAESSDRTNAGTEDSSAEDARR